MNRVARFAGLLACSLLAGSTALAGQAPWVITPDGMGPLKIGMTVSEASKVLGTKLTIDPHDSDAVGCSELDIPYMPGAGMIFENRRLTRVEIFKASRLRTALGIGIGSTEAEVKAKYAPIDDEPQAYDELPAKDLTWWVTKGERGIRFQTDVKRRVDAIFAGTSAITYLEGCE